MFCLSDIDAAAAGAAGADAAAAVGGWAMIVTQASSLQNLWPSGGLGGVRIALTMRGGSDPRRVLDKL